jgi:branched-chain amino acid transport system substrate-binding protein
LLYLVIHIGFEMQKAKSFFTPFLAIIIFISLISACNRHENPPFECKDLLGCVDIAADEPLRLGVLQALSGSVAPLGIAQIRGLELALEKRGNMVAGKQVSLHIEDTNCTAEGGANAALKIIADPQTVAIFGSTCSGAAATASKAMSAAGLTMISGNNSAPFLTSIGGKHAPNWQSGYFRTANNEENAGKTAAEYAYRILGIHKAATLNDNDIYTRGLTDSFQKSFEELGGKLVLSTAVNKGDVEMIPVLQAVASSGAELLFFPLFQQEAKYILTQARQLPEMKHTLLMSDGALIQQSFLDAVGELALGMYFIGPSRPFGPSVDALELAYETKYQEKPTVSYYITAYDAADILFLAIEKTAVHDATGKVHIGRQALRDAMYATQGHEGISGTLNCNSFGDCGQPAFNVLRLDDSTLGLKGLEDNILYSNRSAQ